jgi:hypothetical protein
MSTELTLRRKHLAEHRRMIIGRSLAASLAGLIPFPMFDEWLCSSINRSTIRRIAKARKVDLDDDAIRAIADGPSAPPQWGDLAGGALAFRILSRTWRKMLVAYLATRRAQAATRYFVNASLFDHYCARMHVGLGLDGASGTELRALMGRSIEATSGGVGKRVFRRGAAAAARATVRAPVELLDIASGGALRRLLTRGSDEVEAIEEVDSALDAQLRSQKSFLARAATAIELQLSADQNPYIDELITRFEDMWRGDQGED